MAGSVKNWVDNNPPTCAADDLNGFKEENNNLIESADLVLDDSDNDQTSNAVAAYAAGGNYYTCGGVADAYTLTEVGSRLPIEALQDGMFFKFKVNITNTGASTLNINSLGAKDVVDINNNALLANILNANDFVLVMYDVGIDKFRLLINFNLLANEIPLGNVRVSSSNDKKDNEADCDGSAISRTTYASLFSKYNADGLPWGSGDGSTTFNIPDLRSAALRGVGTPTIFTQNNAIALAQTIDDQLQGHWHNIYTQSNVSAGSGVTVGRPWGSGSADNEVRDLVTDGVNGTPRTGNETTGKARGVYFFVKLY